MAKLRPIVDGLERDPINGCHFAAEDPKISISQVELPKNRIENCDIVSVKIGDRFEVGPYCTAGGFAPPSQLPPAPPGLNQVERERV